MSREESSRQQALANEALRTEALRINQRYIDEIVCAHDLCPWAKSIRDGDGLARQVVFADELSDAALRETLACIEAWAPREEIVVALLVFPRLRCTQPEFRAFVGKLEQAHAANYPRGAVPLAMAAFHPHAAADLTTPARLVPFIRRSPDPTIQLVRRSAMAKVRERDNEGSVFADSLEAFLPLMGKTPTPSVSDSIAIHNHRHISDTGVEHFERLFADIERDRRDAYAAIDTQGGAAAT